MKYQEQRQERLIRQYVSERFSDALSESESEPEAVTVGSVKGNVCGRCEANRPYALPFTETRDTSSRGKAQTTDELSSKATSE